MQSIKADVPAPSASTTGPQSPGPSHPLKVAQQPAEASPPLIRLASVESLSDIFDEASGALTQRERAFTPAETPARNPKAEAHNPFSGLFEEPDGCARSGTLLASAKTVDQVDTIKEEDYPDPKSDEDFMTVEDIHRNWFENRLPELADEPERPNPEGLHHDFRRLAARCKAWFDRITQ